MQRDLDLESWKIFCAVAQTGSISSACDIVDLDAPRISRVIKSLEASLGGIPLFDRSMRPMKLTQNGETAFRYAKNMLDNHRALLESLDKDPTAMRGAIHVGLPPLVLQRFLLPFLISFHKDFPEIVLKVDEYNGAAPINFDTPRGRLDVVCGYGVDTAHPNIVQIHYGYGIQVPCASPMYLNANGVPQTPADLAEHTGIIFDSPMRPTVRHLQKNGCTHYLRWKDEIHFNSAGSAMTATLYGAGIHPGIASLHAFQSIAKGELQVVLPGWSAPPTKLYLYARAEAIRLKRVRVFIERYRAFINRLHHECEAVLKPYYGELQLAVD